MFPLLVLVLSPPCATRTYGHTNKPSANISGLGILFCGLCGNSTQPLGGAGHQSLVRPCFFLLLLLYTTSHVNESAQGRTQARKKVTPCGLR